MYETIMVPVDLGHVDELSKALSTAGDLAKHYDASLCYVGVTATGPGSVAHNDAEYEQKLRDFAAGQASKTGLKTSSKSMVSNDPAIELDDKLLEAAKQIDADLVVMATHPPNVINHFWPSNGGKLGQMADCSVMLVRG